MPLSPHFENCRFFLKHYLILVGFYTGEKEDSLLIFMLNKVDQIM